VKKDSPSVSHSIFAMILTAILINAEF
jgi:hypothetical protein